MNTSPARTYFLLALLLVTFAVAFLIFQPFLTTVALAVVFAVVLNPVYSKIKQSFGKHDALAALATIIIGIVILAIPLSLVGTLVVNQSRSAYTSLVSGGSGASVEEVANNIGSWLEPYAPGATEYAHSISLELNTYLKDGLTWLIQHIGVAFTSILAILLRVLIFIMALYYFLKDGAKLEKLLITRSPLLDEDGSAIFKQLSRTISSVVKGSLLIACIQGTLAGIGYLIFGLPNPALWGASTAISALIPGVGTSLVIIPAVTYLFAVGNVGGGVGLLLWGTLLVGLIDNFLAPRFMGKGAKLHPLVILLSVLGGVGMFGPAGIFMGPLVISFLFALYTVYAKQEVAAA